MDEQYPSLDYRRLEEFMLNKMRDSAHDRHHVYRVLYAAADIAEHENEVEWDVLIAACLLHDIGRDRQFADPAVCHARDGGEMAFQYLLSIGWPEERARRVKDCIVLHRYRGDNPPRTLEAKILFDADKLDASGAIGIARTLIYEGIAAEPLYVLDEDGGIVEEGDGSEPSSFFQEYTYKLANVYDSFYTDRAKQIAQSRRRAAMDFYHALHGEITGIYHGEEILKKHF